MKHEEIKSKIKSITNCKKKVITISAFAIAVIALIVVISVKNSSNKISENNSIKTNSNTQNASELTQTNEVPLELKKEYFYLMKDLENMRFFSNFSNPNEISEDELVLFGYMKASRDEKTFLRNDYWNVKFIDITPYIEKYFNRTIIGKKRTSYFNYDASTEEYVPTGWSFFDGSDPHYLKELSHNSDGSITAVFDVYFWGEDLDISPEDYIFDTSLIPSDIKHVKAESTFYRREQNGQTYLQLISYKRQNNDASNLKSSADKCFKAVPFSRDKYLSDDEFVIAGGVKLGMSYDEALKILGNYDEALDNAPGVKSIIKDGYNYGFYQINKTFTNQSDLKIDGIFRLLNVSLTKYSDDEFPRGIKIGDSIEDVLNKFPGKDKKLRKWAYQNIYGTDEKGKPRAYLEFTMFNECYYFSATTTKQILIVQFDRNNCVSSIEILKEDS